MSHGTCQAQTDKPLETPQRTPLITPVHRHTPTHTPQTMQPLGLPLAQMQRQPQPPKDQLPACTTLSAFSGSEAQSQMPPPEWIPQRQSRSSDETKSTLYQPAPSTPLPSAAVTQSKRNIEQSVAAKRDARFEEYLRKGEREIKAIRARKEIPDSEENDSDLPDTPSKAQALPLDPGNTTRPRQPSSEAQIRARAPSPKTPDHPQPLATQMREPAAGCDTTQSVISISSNGRPSVLHTSTTKANSMWQMKLREMKLSFQLQTLLVQVARVQRRIRSYPIASANSRSLAPGSPQVQLLPHFVDQRG